MENTIRVVPLQKMMVATAGRVDVVNVDHLVRIEAQSNYSKLYLADGTTLVVAKVLRKFEEQLSQNPFIRAHKTHLVNLHFIRSLEGLHHKHLVMEMETILPYPGASSGMCFNSLWACRQFNFAHNCNRKLPVFTN